MLYVFDGFTNSGELVLSDFSVKEGVTYAVGKGLVLDSNRDLFGKGMICGMESFIPSWFR